MNILVIEDSRMVQKAVEGMLKNLGHNVHFCDNGKLAVDYLSQGQDIDIILLDWNMPEMDGKQFLEYNQEHNLTSAKIIMMTTENKPDRIMTALSLGACEYMMKPFDQGIIDQKIKMVA